MTREQERIVEGALERLEEAYRTHPNGSSEIYAAEKVVEFLLGQFA